MSDIIPLVNGALAILIRLAACTLAASTLMLFGLVAPPRREGGPACCETEGALFLISRQTYR